MFPGYVLMFLLSEETSQVLTLDKEQGKDIKSMIWFASSMKGHIALLKHSRTHGGNDIAAAAPGEREVLFVAITMYLSPS